jgi:general secretion pathway protein D
MKHASRLSLVSGLVLVWAEATARGQARRRPTSLPPAPAASTAAPTAAAPPLGAEATGGQAPRAGQGAAAIPTPGVPAAPGTLSQFEPGVDFEPTSPDYRVAFSLEDADLAEIVRVIGQLTGKRFIFGGKIRSIKATVYSPQKITVAEAYQAFLSILETNGLTVVPHGRFLKIVETGGIATQATPTYVAGQGAPAEDRYVTRIQRLGHVSADEVAAVLAHFKTKDADITVYAPGNLLIITDTGANIQRMMQIVEDVDVGSAGDQVWIEPIHYASASEVANRINELFDVKAANALQVAGGGGKASPNGGGDLHVAKIIPDDRTNSLIVVATEDAYLRILEIIKRLDVPQSGEGEIHVLPLQHADAVDLTKTLNEIVTGAGASQAGGPTGAASRPGGAPSGIFEAGVKISADKATNSVVITSSLRDYAQLRAVVDRLDLARRQVFIEAVVLDLTVSNSNTWSVSYHAADTASTGSYGNSLLYGGLNPLNTISLPDSSQLQGLALGIRGPGIPGSANLLGTGLTIPAFGVILNALASSGYADVLSTPHILATDNEDAEINVGQNIPLQTNSGFTGLGSGSGSSAGSLSALSSLSSGGSSGSSRTDVGTKIKIKPHLNESNEVRIELTEEISEAGVPQGSLGVVPITKRNAQTKLVVRDGETVIIGGLMRSLVNHSESKIPILGDVPVLGALFRSTTDQVQKTNLILILTPFIIREQSDLRTVFQRKMQERQEFLDRYFVFEGTDYQPPRDWSHSHGLLDDIRQAYKEVAERKALDEATQPRELKQHNPSDALEMPTNIRTEGGVAAPAQSDRHAAERREHLEVAPPLNVSPPPRRTEQ